MHNQPFSIFQPAEFLLPDNTDLQKWAVIACDQHTSEPEYWQNISDLVGSSPSTLRMMIPEHLYTEPDLPERIRSTHDSMASYLEQGLFRTISPCYIYIERTLSNGKIRRGILGAIDLEQYDYHADSSAMIRATEGTVAEKLPARITIRTGAPLELSHVMVLADDPKQLLLDPLTAQKDSMELLYDFPLMEGGGHIRGYRADGAFAEHIASVLARFADPDYFNQRYSLKGQAPMVLATGDGNHSLATAKARWETIKTGLTEEARQTHPARFSMVELINIHDPALEFEPINRMVFDTDPEALLQGLLEFYPGSYLTEDPGEIAWRLQDGGHSASNAENHRIRYAFGSTTGQVVIPKESAVLAIGALSHFLDSWLPSHGGKLDFVHDNHVILRLSRKPGAIGFILPAINKTRFFPSIIADGSLPRKTFSMGFASDKRYYLECRKL